MMLLAALAASLSLMAEAPAAAPAGQPVAAQPAKPALICKKIMPLGSRMPKKVCQTPEQIAQEQADAKEMTREMQKTNPEPVR